MPPIYMKTDGEPQNGDIWILPSVSTFRLEIIRNGEPLFPLKQIEKDWLDKTIKELYNIEELIDG